MTQRDFGESDCPVDNFYATIGTSQRKGIHDVFGRFRGRNRRHRAYVGASSP